MTNISYSKNEREENKPFFLGTVHSDLIEVDLLALFFLELCYESIIGN